MEATRSKILAVAYYMYCVLCKVFKVPCQNTKLPPKTAYTNSFSKLVHFFKFFHSFLCHPPWWCQMHIISTCWSYSIIEPPYAGPKIQKASCCLLYVLCPVHSLQVALPKSKNTSKNFISNSFWKLVYFFNIFIASCASLHGVARCTLLALLEVTQ